MFTARHEIYTYGLPLPLPDALPICRARAVQRFHHTASRLRPIEGLPLRGAKAWAATAACALPVLLGFVLPAGVLANYAFLSSTAAWTPEFFRHALNSLGLATTAAAVAVTRSDARRVGTECVSTCRDRGRPQHKKKKNTT